MLGHGRPPGPRPGGRRPIEHVTLTLLVVLGLAVFFDYVNGFHDTANAIATSVATRALRPAYAIAMATAFNFIGVKLGSSAAVSCVSGLFTGIYAVNAGFIAMPPGGREPPDTVLKVDFPRRAPRGLTRPTAFVMVG